MVPYGCPCGIRRPPIALAVSALVLCWVTTPTAGGLALGDESPDDGQLACMAMAEVHVQQLLADGMAAGGDEAGQSSGDREGRGAHTVESLDCLASLTRHTASLVGQGVMRSMWATPVYSVQLLQPLPAPHDHADDHDVGGGGGNPLGGQDGRQTHGHSAAQRLMRSATERLAKRALLMHQAFQQEQLKNSHSSGRTGGATRLPAEQTDAFFRWQQQAGNRIDSCPPHVDGTHASDTAACTSRRDVLAIKSAVLNAAAVYGATLGWDEHAMAEVWGPEDVQVWVGVLRGAERHRSHVHRHTDVSGTYYLDAPPGAGELVFHDPRGPLPPFQHTVAVQPRTGELVMFPPWLVHEVEASRHRVPAPRVALSFNIGRDSMSRPDTTGGTGRDSMPMERGWDLTSDVSAAFAVPGRQPS